jgi:hypothetical protein
VARRAVASAEPLSTTITSSTAPSASRTTPAIVASSSRAGMTATRCIPDTLRPNHERPRNAQHDKLGVSDRAAAVAEAMRRGLLE